MNQLYCDGGVIGRNPSSIGGTYAWRILSDDRVVLENAEVITPTPDLPEITNNLTEMRALVRGLQNLPDDWIGTIYSDSQITLGRAFQGWKWNRIPAWLREEFAAERARLVNWEKISFVLLAGHPTKAQLAAGIGHSGLPVSEHNQWCDWACGRATDSVKSLIAEYEAA